MAISTPEKYSYEETQEAISALPEKYKQIACLAYATGARVSELIQIKKGDISFKEEYLEIICPVLKKRDGVGSRTALVRLTEDWLVEPIKSLMEGKQDTEVLLPYHRATIYTYLKKNVVIKGDHFNPHGFRKLRATHLVVKFGFNGQQLKHFFDWSRSDMADRYVKLNLNDIKY